MFAIKIKKELIELVFVRNTVTKPVIKIKRRTG